MITIHTDIAKPIQEVWDKWTQPTHIMNWNYAGDDWHCPASEADLQEGGRFTHTMAARDGSFSFDFSGTYNVVKSLAEIRVILDDQRGWITTFEETPQGTRVTESFDPESMNPEDMQRAGWQMILDRFKGYVEASWSVRQAFNGVSPLFPFLRKVLF